MRFAITVAALLALSWPAGAQTTEQNYIINHIADAVVLAERCPTMMLNMTTAATITLFNGIPGDAFSPGGKFERQMRSSIARARDDAGALAGDAACLAALVMFGPNGGNVPNLLHRR